ncbi:MAG: mannose-1-phosphate guanylyltransferase/mannose-6-phosphate isomerase [Pseudomonadota bacterium]
MVENGTGDGSGTGSTNTNASGAGASAGSGIVPVIMCGGSGSRLWPVSRKAHPKQFAPLLGGQTLFQRTVERVRDVGYGDPVYLTNADFRFIVAEQMSDIDAAAGRIVIEPEGRNTAPAICVAALMAVAEDPTALLLVLPSDHVLQDVAAFHAAVEAGAGAAREGAFVTFGIQPDRPETGYGYLELAETGRAGPQPFLRFVEKPDAPRAAEMLESGRFLWNSGMFLFPAAGLLDAFAAHAPEVLAACRAAIVAGREDLCFFRLGEAEYRENPDISVDYAIMERVAGTVVPIDCGWNDLGSWKTVWQESEPGEDGVAISGSALGIDCRNALLRSDDPDVRLVGLGLEDVIAVATRDGVLVASMDRAQEVRKVVDGLKAQNAKQATEFPKHYRPWGWYETLALGGRFQVKQIMVKPGGQLSLQSHVHRSEHWVVVSGTARVTVDDEVKLMTENQSVYIPLGAVHRLENPGKLELRLIEVQSGAYLGEDDIIRYEDVYARA